MFFSRPSGHRYVDRGDPDGADFDQSDFTVSGTWTDIDLSSIVPAGAKLVFIGIAIKDSDVSAVLQFRKKGNTYFIEGDNCYLQVANKQIGFNKQIPCDNNRKIQYKTNKTGWTVIDFVVKGWLI